MSELEPTALLDHQDTVVAAAPHRTDAHIGVGLGGWRGVLQHQVMLQTSSLISHFLLPVPGHTHGFSIGRRLERRRSWS